VLLEGFAVFMMFNLKKTGFWLYTLSQVGMLSIMMYIFPMDNTLTMVTLFFSGLLILVFEILYAVNLKHMK